jgi:hypothetical protein
LRAVPFGTSPRDFGADLFSRALHTSTGVSRHNSGRSQNQQFTRRLHSVIWCDSVPRLPDSDRPRTARALRSCDGGAHRFWVGTDASKSFAKVAAATANRAVYAAEGRISPKSVYPTGSPIDNTRFTKLKTRGAGGTLQLRALCLSLVVVDYVSSDVILLGF